MNDDKHADHYSFLSDKHWIADPVQAVFMSGPRKALFRAIMKQKPKKVLDVCCGTGVMANWFASRGIETIGIDSSQTMLGRAERKGRITRAKLMDAGQMEFDKEFYGAYINLAIYEMAPELRERVWQKMVQAVRDGGIVTVMDLNAPQKDARFSRFWRGFFELDERNFLRTNPAHYSNYCEFIQNGGLESWMTQRVTKLDSEKYFFAGNIGVLSAVVGNKIHAVKRQCAGVGPAKQPESTWECTDIAAK